MNFKLNSACLKQWVSLILGHGVHTNLFEAMGVANFWDTVYTPISCVCQVQTLYDDAPMPGRHCFTVSGGTLDTGLWYCITTASLFSYQPSTDSSATSVDHIRWFTVTGPSMWNSLPKCSCSHSTVFGRLLKTFLFSGYECTQCIRGFGDNVLYKYTFYITSHYGLA